MGLFDMHLTSVIFSIQKLEAFWQVNLPWKPLLWFQASWRPRIQDISTEKMLFCKKADGRNGICLSAVIRLYLPLSAFSPLPTFIGLSAFSSDQPFPSISLSKSTALSDTLTSSEYTISILKICWTLTNLRSIKSYELLHVISLEHETPYFIYDICIRVLLIF